MVSRHTFSSWFPYAFVGTFETGGYITSEGFPFLDEHDVRLEIELRVLI